MILRHFFLFSLLLFLLSPAWLVAKKHPQCSLCGMDLNKYTHVRYTVSTTSGEQITTCGVQCGLLLQLNLDDNFKSAIATDLLTHNTMPAEKAWYVY